MGTGLGPESYAIIEQGRIGQILSNQAAGPPRHHRRSRRHHQVQDQEAAGGSQARRRQAESGACVRHSGRSEPPGQFAQAAGVQGPALRGTEERVGWRSCARSLTGRYPDAGARRRQDRAGSESRDRRVPELCRTRWPSASRSTTALQETCYRNEAELTEARQKLADLHVEPGAHARQAGIASEGDRRHRAAHRAGRDRDAGARAAAWTQLREELAGASGGGSGARRADRIARERLAAKIHRARTAAAGVAGAVDARFEAGRQMFCGCWAKRRRSRTSWRRSTSIWPAIEREPRASQREEEAAVADIERLAALEASSPRRWRAPVGAGIHRRPASAAHRRRPGRSASAARPKRGGMLDQLKTEASRLKARKDSLEEILSHRAYTTESVKRLFTALEQGKPEDFEPRGVLADFMEVDTSLRKADRRIPARRAGIRGGRELERSRARHRFHARRSGWPRHVPGASGADGQSQAGLPEPAIGRET